MCKWGTDELVKVTIPADLSYTGKSHRKLIGIDECIASIVRALEEGEIMMRASCCGHGKTNGSILLQDGRELIIRSSR